MDSDRTVDVSIADATTATAPLPRPRSLAAPASIAFHTSALERRVCPGLPLTQRTTNSTAQTRPPSFSSTHTDCSCNCNRAIYKRSAVARPRSSCTDIRCCRAQPRPCPPAEHGTTYYIRARRPGERSGTGSTGFGSSGFGGSWACSRVRAGTARGRGRATPWVVGRQRLRRA